MKTLLTQFSKATLAYSFIFLTLVVNKSQAQADHVGSGTRGGGEIVYINGEMRFRDMVDNTTYECFPEGSGYITNNSKFNELMTSFRETNPYAEYIFREEANQIAVCFVNEPLRYLSTEDSCALYETPNLPRALIGVRRSGNRVLLVNERNYNQLQRRTRDKLDIGAFFVHEVARSFIPYDCENNTNVRNFTGLILRNHTARLSNARFNGEMQIFNVNLPTNSIGHDLANDLQIVLQENISLSEKLNAALRIRTSGINLSSRTRTVVNALLRDATTNLQVAILSNDQELTEIYARINGAINVEVQGVSALTYAILQNNVDLYSILKTFATYYQYITTFNEIVRANNHEALAIFLQNTDSIFYTQNETLDKIISFTRAEYNYTVKEAFNYLLDERLLPFNAVIYQYAVRVNQLAVAARVAQNANLGDEYINLANSIGETIVTRAIQAGDTEAVMSFINTAAFNPRLTNRGGDNYLHMAVSYGRVKIVKILARRFPELTSMHNRAGRTPLALAQRQQNRAIIDILN